MVDFTGRAVVGLTVVTGLLVEGLLEEVALTGLLVDATGLIEGVELTGLIEGVALTGLVLALTGFPEEVALTGLTERIERTGLLVEGITLMGLMGLLVVGAALTGLAEGEALTGFEVGIKDGLLDVTEPALRTKLGKRKTSPKLAAQPATTVTEPAAGITNLAVKVVESIPIYFSLIGVAATLEFAPPAVQAVPSVNVAPPNIYQKKKKKKIKPNTLNLT